MEKWSRECSTIALYQMNPEAQELEAAYDFSLKIFQQLGYEPELLGYSRPGLPGNRRDFKRKNAKLRKEGFEKVNGFSIMTEEPDADYFGFYILSIIYSASCFSVSVRSSILSLEADEFSKIAAHYASLLRPEYGYGYRRDIRRGPEYYAVGLICTAGLPDESQDEEFAINQWSSYGRKNQIWRDGMIRDVYPLNYLNPSHLAFRIGGKSLINWVRAAPNRGTIEDFVGNLSVWKVADEGIPSVRAAAIETGLIPDWRADGSSP